MVTVRLTRTLPLVAAAVLAAATGDYLSVRTKLDQIDSDRLQPGTRVTISPRELNAYAEHEVPDGVRNPRLFVVSPGVARGTAMVDFAKVRRAQGHEPGWLMRKLLEGERPVSVTARIQSAGGRAKVDVQSVEISGVIVDGRTLDFLIQNILMQVYPDAV